KDSLGIRKQQETDVTETQRLEKRELKKSRQLSRLVTSDVSIVCDSVTNTKIEKTETPLATPKPEPPFTLKSPTLLNLGECIAKSIITNLNDTGINPEDLLAVGCDGIAVNMGKKNDALQFLELEFSRPLQWLICQLHMNELPLPRHLFQYLYGRTKGPKEYFGAITKAIKYTVSAEVRKFLILDLNFNATQYFELINRQKDFITAPPILEAVSDNDIKMLIHDHYECKSADEIEVSQDECEPETEDTEQEMGNDDDGNKTIYAENAKRVFLRKERETK
ncbi:hypothetical protein ILUMI_17071, partial [Ignelater luminosus]